MLNYFYLKDNHNEYSYTSGLRPIIRIKLDTIKKINDNKLKKILEESKKLDRKIVSVQEKNNKSEKVFSVANSNVEDEYDTYNNKNDNNECNNISYRENSLINYVELISSIIILLLVSLFFILKLKKTDVNKK